ncbi:hypothetical protein AAMO2058_001481200 [Amorphochlora amoebiformis]
MLFVDDLGYGDLGFTGHPTTETPNIDRLAKNGKILTTWYSGCPVCSGSRSALMTGRQYTRVGIPGVFGPTSMTGIPDNETTVAEQLKKAGYATGIMGKWHLGQREMFLPSKHGFDKYLGIPYSDDMGEAKVIPCNGEDDIGREEIDIDITDATHHYQSAGFYDGLSEPFKKSDPAARHLPLLYQSGNITKVIQQPINFLELADRYAEFVTDFISENKKDPFFLYMPFSHVHTTAVNQPEMQYASCAFQNTTKRGRFGDALAEADYIVGQAIKALKEHNLEENTLILFSSDNGPWMARGKSAGSPGVLYGRSSGYWNVGKGSTWEGGIREPAFAYWPGIIRPHTRSSEPYPVEESMVLGLRHAE